MLILRDVRYPIKVSISYLFKTIDITEAGTWYPVIKADTMYVI